MNANEVRLGIIGTGNMGRGHARTVLEGLGGRNRLAAVADSNAECLAQLQMPDRVARFSSASELMESGLVDAVLIATPHFSHPSLAQEALRRGLHVLVEKPVAVDVQSARALAAAPRRAGQVFAAMFNQRTDPCYQRLRALLRDGELGRVQRINWIITDWYRPDAYYASGTWRATWAGEGGGVLLNQCPHQLDLWQWLFGMPLHVQAWCQMGRYHDIEVEDDVTAVMHYADGASGVFIASTGEAPGTNRLDVAADRGRVVVEGGRIVFTRNEVPASEFSRTTKDLFGAPPVRHLEFPVGGSGPQHAGVLKNFADAILDGVPLIAPGDEGVHSVELANAMLYTSATARRISLPLDGAAYRAWLETRMAGSRFKAERS